MEKEWTNIDLNIIGIIIPQAAEYCFRTVFRRFPIFRQGRCTKNLDFKAHTYKSRFLAHLP